VTPRPWLAQYDPGQPAEIAPEFSDMLSLFQAAARRAPDRPAALYFDGRLSFAELDRLSGALAGLLAREGFSAGDRLAIYLQNVPAFLVALVAAWKAGGIAVPVNPMNRERELALLLDDCAPAALVCHDSLFDEVVARLPEGKLPRTVLTASPLDFQTRDDPRLFGDAPRRTSGSRDLLRALAEPGLAPPPAPSLGSGDAAMLVYTSGTTGRPKGAILTHGAVAHNAQVYRDWLRMPDGAPILAMAPLFHVTGLVGHVAAAFLAASPLVLSYRFQAGVMLDAAAEHRPAFAIGAITAFSALLADPGLTRDRVASLTTLASGGAPIPPAVAERVRAAFGTELRNAYGLTETASPTHFSPLTRPARVDPASGALSIGLPVFGAHAWIAGDDGAPLPPGETGEIVVSGPMVSPGYWRQPEASAEAMRPDGFRTGDVGFMDADGWFYLVDRKKDMINAGGYKVWPREVEDVLCSHPAVREAAVVGVPDEYRGETVKAAVSLKPGAAVDPAALIAWCGERMAAYKRPRILDVVDDLPKTATGKILRREIR
jgi:long-chain acyl-CoA synthetase